MSLSTQVKEEICRFSGDNCCKKAFLSAVIHINAVLNFDKNGLRVQINCEHGLPLIESIFCSLYQCKYSVENGKFCIFPPDARDILVDLGIFDLIDGATLLNEGSPKRLLRDICCKKSYLKGAFLASGSVSVASYGLEIVANSQKICADLANILREYKIRALTGRKNGKFRVYVRDKDGVCDTLAVMEAIKSTLSIHSLSVERDLRRDLSRKANCDVYNADKALRTSLEQIEAINNVELCDNKLIEMAKARLNNPDATYDELKNILNVSKSTVKYRLNKIVQLYKNKINSSEEKHE